MQDAHTEQDEVIASLVTAVSRAIARFCGREFAPRVDGAVRTFEFPVAMHGDTGGPLISLAPFDARALTAVVLDTGRDTEDTLTSSEWRLESLDSRHSVYGSIRLDYRVSYTGTWPTRTLTATGNWGFDTVPDDVREACILAVSTHLRQDVQAFGGPLQPNSIADDVNAAVAFPPGVRGLLAPFMRML